MKKLIATSFILIALGGTSHAQEKPTKIEQFSSKTGQMVRFEDTNKSIVQTSYAKIELSARKLTVGKETAYFLQIRNGEATASIEYSDLVEVLKATDLLIKSAAKDIDSPIPYLEQKFRAERFVIGYYKSGTELKWYMELDRTRDGSIFFDSPSTIKAAMVSVKQKIDEMKGKK